MRGFLLAALHLLLSAANAQTFEQFMKDFSDGYHSLNIPGLTLSYREYLRGIPDTAALNRQELFF